MYDRHFRTQQESTAEHGLVTHNDAIRLAKCRLMGRDGASDKQAEVDARLLLALATTDESAECPGGRMSPRSKARLESLCDDVCARAGMVQHLLGWQLFCSRLYQVTPNVLVCHPSTELLVGLALTRLERTAGPLVGIEIGVGSGVISIELLRRIPTLRMLATDCSSDALAISAANLRASLPHEEDRLELIETASDRNVLEPFLERGDLRGHVDFIISNPPYLVPHDSVSRCYREHMPAQAVYSPDAEGMFFYREIATNCAALLRRSGMIYLEARFSRATEVASIFSSMGWSSRLRNRDQIIDLMQRENACESLRHSLMNQQRSFKNHGYLEIFKN